MATLVEELRAIDSVPDSAAVDKPSSYRNLLRQWYEKSDLVRKFMSGQTLPSKETDRLARRIGGWRAFVPFSHFGDKYKQQVKELEPIVQEVDTVSDRAWDLVGNPVSLSVVYGALFTILSYLHNVQPGSPSYNSPQEIALGSAALGALFGIPASLIRLSYLGQIRTNGQYLESKIREIGGI